MRNMLVAFSLFVMLAGCVTTPTGSNALSPEGEAALQVSVRIAVRHAVADSPRAAAKAQNIRHVIAQLQGVLTAESTLVGLKNEVSAELDTLGLTPLDRADAQDLLDLVAVALEARLGPDALKSEGVVRVSEFLSMVLAALPA